MIHLKALVSLFPPTEVIYTFMISVKKLSPANMNGTPMALNLK